MRRRHVRFRCVDDQRCRRFDQTNKKPTNRFLRSHLRCRCVPKAREIFGEFFHLLFFFVIGVIYILYNNK